MLEAINLRCLQQRLLFSNLHFQLLPGELILITGENGSGKSSLLRILTGCYLPEAGEVYWNNRSIHACLMQYRQNIHYVGHLNGIKLGLTTAENICLMEHLFLTHSGSCHTLDKTALLTEFTLDSHLHQLAGNLSAGQKRKLALIKLFLFPKKLWILDEPLTFLDKPIQIIFLKKLAQHLKAGGMVMMSTHQSIRFMDEETPINIKTVKLSC